VVDFDTMCNYTARTRNFCGRLCTKEEWLLSATVLSENHVPELNPDSCNLLSSGLPVHTTGLSNPVFNTLTIDHWFVAVLFPPRFPQALPAAVLSP
jgi:hypothetical protein